MSPEEGKGEEACYADIIPISPGTQVSPGHFFSVCPDYFTESKIDHVFDSLISLRWEKNSEVSQIPTRKPYIFIWLLVFLKGPNQNLLFSDIMITFSSMAPHWNYLYYSIYHCIGIIWSLITSLHLTMNK